MSDQGEGMSIAQETRSVMPGEDAMSAGIEMDAMSDEATDGEIVDLLPGEEVSSVENDAMAESTSLEMSAADTIAGIAMTEMGGASTMPGEEGMGEIMTDLMPSEEVTTSDIGKTGAEISGTFRLTLMPN